MREIKNTMIYKWFQKVWNEGKSEAMGEFLSDDVIAHGASPDGSTHGIAEFKNFYEAFRSQFKDVNVTVKDIICQDNMESAICDVKAIEVASDRPVEFSGLCAIRIENNKAVEAWNQFDFLKMYQQIGFELAMKKN